MKKAAVSTLAIVAACAMGAATAWAAETETQIPTSGEKVDGAPYEFKTDSGTFKLADRIAAKVKAGEKINYVFSYQASGIPLFSPQFAAGFVELDLAETPAVQRLVRVRGRRWGHVPIIGSPRRQRQSRRA